MNGYFAWYQRLCWLYPVAWSVTTVLAEWCEWSSILVVGYAMLSELLLLFYDLRAWLNAWSKTTNVSVNIYIGSQIETVNNANSPEVINAFQYFTSKLWSLGIKFSPNCFHCSRYLWKCWEDEANSYLFLLIIFPPLKFCDEDDLISY